MIQITVAIKDGITPTLLEMERDLEKNIKTFFGEARTKVYDTLIPHIDHTCHTLDDLRRLGHPYAKDRYGSYPGDPDDIHAQGTDMYEAFNPEKKLITEMPHYQLEMGFDANKNRVGYDHAKFVQDAGASSKMYPRPILQMVTMELRSELIDMFHKHIGNLSTLGRI